MARQRKRQQRRQHGEQGGPYAPPFFHDRGEKDVEERKSTFEVRKELRAQRRKELESLKEREPAEDADDPRDVAAIYKAKNEMGDFNLKGSSKLRRAGEPTAQR